MPGGQNIINVNRQREWLNKSNVQVKGWKQRDTAEIVGHRKGYTIKYFEQTTNTRHNETNSCLQSTRTVRGEL